MFLRILLLIIPSISALGFLDEETHFITDKLSTLVQTHIIYSPGERTPRTIFTYPTDPHINDTYFPFGPGELNARGRKNAFKLGKQLYSRYSKFLGPVYSPQFFESYATYYPWTQTSIQAVHAALFPPTLKHRVAEGFPWQAVPYIYHSFEEDSLLASYRACPIQLSLTEELESTPKYEKALREFDSLREYATKHAGIGINGTIDLEFLYTRLAAQENLALELPEWTASIYPEPLRKAGNFMWRIMAESPVIQRLACGEFLKKITNDFASKVTGQNSKKMYLYSTTDFAFTPLMGAIGNYNGGRYKTYSYLLFELHKINGTYGVKTYLWDHSSTKLRLIKILDCAEFCPLSQFTDLLKDKFPLENWCSI